MSGGICDKYYLFSFKILLFSTSTTSGGNRGDIALDAFKVVEGSCNVLRKTMLCNYSYVIMLKV